MMNPTALMKKKGAKPIPVANIQPNRMNPNEMKVDTWVYLEKDMKIGDYDPITVSPMNVFYHETPELITVSFEKAKEHYVVCDGEHRLRCAQRAGLEEIWAFVQYWTERDAMAHFYKRQRIRGELDPLKEAELFAFEIKVNKRSRKEVIQLFNLPSMKYLKTRLEILKVTKEVVDLFYAQEDYPGRLTMSHMGAISRLEREDQYPVAVMALQRNWSRDDVIDEVRRIKEGRGTRQPQSTVKAPEEVPGSRPTQVQRGLHPNIDVLLKGWQEDIIMRVKDAGDEGVARSMILNDAPVGESAVRTFLRKMVDKEVLVSFAMYTVGRRGRKPIAYRLFVVKEPEPRPETEPQTDEELFKEYSEEARKEPEIKGADVVELGEAATRALELGRESSLAEVPEEGEPKVTEPLESWVEVGLEAVRVEFLTKDILSNFMDKVFKLAVAEGFDLLTTKKIDGREPDQWLIDELSEDLESFIISRDMDEPDLRALAGMTLRACQLDYRLSLYDDKPKGEDVE